MELQHVIRFSYSVYIITMRTGSRFPNKHDPAACVQARIKKGSIVIPFSCFNIFSVETLLHLHKTISPCSFCSVVFQTVFTTYMHNMFYCSFLECFLYTMLPYLLVLLYITFFSPTSSSFTFPVTGTRACTISYILVCLPQCHTHSICEENDRNG